MSKFGLYVADATEDIELEGYKPTNKKWKRTGLFYNGSPVHKTTLEDNKFGIYAKGTDITLNGNSIASTTTTNPSLKLVKSKVLFGDAVLKSDKCINITLENYNKLRKGNKVSGYARYDSKAVYNIVSDINQAEEVEYNLPENLDDKIYNSFTDQLLYNEVSQKTYTDPTHTPALAIRAFDAILKKGQGVTFEYFVDTYDYSSMYNSTIGDTFTLIVEDSFNNVLYKHTTYAGEFICTTLPFKDELNNDLVGLTWFSVRCIDSLGRTSVDKFFKVLIKEELEPNIYLMTSNDLETYHITANTAYDDCVSGYNNKWGFEKLFAWCKEHGYDGIKVYNSHLTTTLGDSRSDLYRIDNHHKLLAYKDSEIATSESELSHYIAYYLVEYRDGVIQGINKTPEEYTREDFNQFKILPGGSVTINNKTWNIPSGVTPYLWIRRDGANIYRNADNKIIVFWAHDLYENEVPVEWTTTIAKSRVLRIKSLNGLLFKSKKDKLSDMFAEGEGYYYLTLLAGVHPTFDGSKDRDFYDSGINPYPVVSNPIKIPNDFIIDLNYTTWEYTDSTDIYTKNKMFHFSGITNSHLKNGKLVGAYTSDRAKDAFLKCCRSNSGAWEGYSLMALDGAEFCTIDNVEVCQSGGYETVLGSLIASQTVTGANYGIKSVTGKSSGNIIHSEDIMRLATLGYVNNGILSTDDAVIKDNGKSILPSTPPAINTEVDYNHWDGATDVCLVTSDDYINLDLHFNFTLNGTKLDWELDNTIPHGYYISSSCYSPTRSWHGGKRSEFFVSFYNLNNLFIKTIKITQHRIFYSPVGATKIKLTGYGLCNVNNTNVLLVLDPTYNVERSLKDITISMGAYTQGCKFTNYCVHNTRTIATCGAGYNVQFNNCRFYEIASAPGRLAVTKMFMDVEENCNRGSVVSFTNCLVEANMYKTGGYQNSQTLIGIVAEGLEYSIENCVGLSIAGCLTDCLIKDSTMGLLRIGSYKNLANRCFNIIKRVKVIYTGEFLNNPTKNIIVGTAKAGYKLRNTSDESPILDVYLEDSIINSSANNYGNMNTIGRCYYIKNKVTDNYK